MKVLVLSNMYPSKWSKTFGIFVKNQVELLKREGIEADVIGIGDPRKGKFRIMKKYLFFFLKCMVTLLIRGRQYQAVHVHYIFPTGIAGLWFKKVFGTRLIVTAHGGDIDQMAKKSGLTRKWTKQILQECDHLIVVGEKLKEDVLSQFKLENEKISVINMGVNREVFRPRNNRELRNELGIPAERFILLFVGNFIKAKGLKELIEAYQMFQKRYPDSELHLIGEAKDPDFYETITSIIKEKTIPNIVFHESMDQNRLSKWMAVADVFVLPSHMEGFGLVALEAMACGTPVIGSDVGGLSYLLSGDAGVKVEPKNIEALYRAMENLYQDDQLKQKLIENGQLKSRQNDQKVLIRKVIDLYHS